MADQRRNRRRDQTTTRPAPAGYPSGPDAPLEATAAALALTESARSVVLVEGVSDQVAVEALARRHGRDFDAEGVVVVPIGGAQAITRYLRRFGPRGQDLHVTGMCDAGEEDYFRLGLISAGFEPPADRLAMEGLGFLVEALDLDEIPRPLHELVSRS